MASNPVPPGPAVRDDDQPAEGLCLAAWPVLTRRDLLRKAGMAASVVAASAALPALAAAPAGAVTGVPATGAAAAAAPLKLARVWAVNAAQRAALAGFDDTHNVFDDGSVEYLLWPGDEARLRATGAAYEITVPDVVARDTALLASAPGRPVDLAPQPGERADYRRLPDYEADMRALAAKYPDKARVIALPHRTYEGRTVFGIEIATDVARNEGRAVYYNDGVHHAREWPAAEVPIMWAFDLLDNYGKDARITNIVDNVRNVIVPVVNPDGFNQSREFGVDTVWMAYAPYQIGQGQYVRKNCRSETGDAAGMYDPPNATSYGVDNNRNYAYAWGGAGSSSLKIDGTYRGPAPLSEPESRNVSHVLRTHHATAMITHHTSGNLVLWAWGDTRDDAPDNDLLEGLGRVLAAYNDYKPQKSIDLYITTGTCADYAYGAFGSVGYTFEHAGSSFHPAYASTVPAMYAKNRQALILLAEECCLVPELRPAGREIPPGKLTRGSGVDYHGVGMLHHAVLSGRLVDAAGNGIAGTVTLHKQFETLLWKAGDGTNPTGQRSYTETIETVMDTAADGTFTYNVNPSTRPYLTFEGQQETYTLTATGAAGTATQPVFIARGQRLDLGDLRLS